MSYWNPIARYGIERFTGELAEAGGAGCILPDLPLEESEPWCRAAGPARSSAANGFPQCGHTSSNR